MIVEPGTYNIYFRRGDTDSLTIRMCNEYFQAGDVVHLTVRESADHEILLQKEVVCESEGDSVSIVFDHDDTENIDFGRYVYDIQLETDGTYMHIVPPQANMKLPIFTVTEEATY